MDGTANFKNIQGHPYVIWPKNPVQDMDCIAILFKNPDPSIIQNEKISDWKSDIFHRGGGTDKKWNGPIAASFKY